MSLKAQLTECKKVKEIIDDNSIKNKIDKVYSILESYKEKDIDLDLIEVVLRTQEFLQEISEDDNNS